MLLFTFMITAYIRNSPGNQERLYSNFNPHSSPSLDLSVFIWRLNDTEDVLALKCTLWGICLPPNYKTIRESNCRSFKLSSTEIRNCVFFAKERSWMFFCCCFFFFFSVMIVSNQKFCEIGREFIPTKIKSWSALSSDQTEWRATSPLLMSLFPQKISEWNF